MIKKSIGSYDSIYFSLFATFEMAPEYDVDVYQEVVSRVRIRDVITATGIDT